MPNVDFLQKSLEMILFIYDDNKKNKKIIDYSFCLDRAPRYKDSTKVLSYALATVSTSTIECM